MIQNVHCNMSNLCDVTAEKCEGNKSVMDIVVPNLNYKEELTEYPELVEYIDKLHTIIKIQSSVLGKIHNALSYSTESVDGSTHNVAEKTAVSSVTNHNNTVPDIDNAAWTSPNTVTDIGNLAEEVKQAAQCALSNTNFVYEPVSGMYYDYGTGYYYDADTCLYYDGNTGFYYQYDEKNQQYNYHPHTSMRKRKQESEVSSDDLSNKSNQKFDSPDNNITSDNLSTNALCSTERRSQTSLESNFKSECSKSSTKRSKPKVRRNSELEEGECSDSSETSSNCSADAIIEAIGAGHPAMRIIVMQSNNPKVKVGTLFLITCKGGTLGREGKHEILIPDISVSKNHLKVTYAEYSRIYYVIDTGSRNGTFLNGARMSETQKSSPPIEITHGSSLQVGCIKMLCHIHLGNDTCGFCEPGIVQNEYNAGVVAEEGPKLIKADLRNQHRKELQRLRKQYGLTTGSEQAKEPATVYLDRAQTRRDTVGVDSLHAKTEMASVDQSISKQNIGFKLLSKMGWSSGEGLGKNGLGLKEPVPLVNNPGTSGLGLAMPDLPSDAITELKREKWKKAQKRYNQCSSAQVRPWSEDHEQKAED